MKKVFRFMIAILVSLFTAVGAYFWTIGMLESLYAFRSPIKDAPPAAGQKTGPAATRRVLFVLVDALRYDTSLQSSVMPTLAMLRQVGATAGMHSRTPSFSQTGYSTLLTGAWPEVNDAPPMNLYYKDIRTWTQDNLLSAVARAGGRTAVSGYYWFEKLIPQESVTTSFYTPGEDASADRHVIDVALPWLENASQYQFILIHLDQVDYAGHNEGGPRSENWTAAARRADGEIAEILQKLDLKKDTLVIASDHGQIDRGGHGGQELVTREEPFILAGAGVIPGKYGEIQMVDLAPTLAALLGVNIPASSQGQILTQMLALSIDETGPLRELQADQQEHMVRAYTAAIGEKLAQSDEKGASQWLATYELAKNSRLARERFLRSGIALLALGLIAWLLYLRRGMKPLALIAGVLVYLVLFNLRYAIINGNTYSFSSVSGEMEMILYCAITSTLSFLVSWLIYALGAGFSRLSPGQAADEVFRLAQAVTAVLILPSLANFTLNGQAVAWTLPEPFSFFLAMLSQIQILVVSGVGLLLAGLAALAVWAAQFVRRKTAVNPVEPLVG